VGLGGSGQGRRLQNRCEGGREEAIVNGGQMAKGK
jgi:hypothetical protein